MTAAARLARSLRHRLGDAAIAWGVRLTHDAGPTMTPAQERRCRRALDLASAIMRQEDAARARMRAMLEGGGENGATPLQ